MPLRKEGSRFGPMPGDAGRTHPEGGSQYFKSQLILALEAGGAVGLVMNASELDMISSAMHQEYGNMMM